MRRLLEYFQDQQMHREPLLLWEMANLTPAETGVQGVIIFVSPGHGLQHGPRIKVAIGNKWSDNNVTIPLTGKPRIIGDSDLTQDQFADILTFVKLNKVAIMNYWNGEESSTKKFIDSLIPVSQS